jgi:hypothetical protein
VLSGVFRRSGFATTSRSGRPNGSAPTFAAAALCCGSLRSPSVRCAAAKAPGKTQHLFFLAPLKLWELKFRRARLLPIVRAMICNRGERPQRTCGPEGERPQPVTLWNPSGLKISNDPGSHS